MYDVNTYNNALYNDAYDNACILYKKKPFQ